MKNLINRALVAKKTKFFTLILACVLVLGVKAQEPENPVEPQSAVPSQCEDVLLQGFYCDSYYGRSSYGSTRWATLLKQAQEIGRYFDLVWLPPSSLSADGTGYQPKQYSNQNSAWGTRAELEQLISAFHSEGTKVIADVVLNNIVGDSTWCDFMPQDFDQYGLFQPDGSYITSGDEINWSETMEYAGDCWGYSQNSRADDGENWDAARDWAHDNPDVQDMFKAYLKWMKNVMHYDGWRYDKGDGYHNMHKYNYNRTSTPYIAFEERWAGIDQIKQGIQDAQMDLMALDFQTKFSAIDAIAGWNYIGRGAGLMADDYWKKHAVTFVDNHDMFMRENSSLEFGGHGNSLTPDLKFRLLNANALILSMPGVPCVFYPHWNKYKVEIGKMIDARHSAGIHSESEVRDEYWDNDGTRNTGYQATIVGKNGWLVLRLGTKANGQGFGEGWRLMASGYSTFNNYGNLINESYEMWVYCTDTASYINNDTTYAPVVEDQFTISVNGDSRQGTVAGGGMYYYYDTCVIEAIPHEGLRFVQWNDGNTDNPRTIRVTHNMTLEAIFISTNQSCIDYLDLSKANCYINNSEPPSTLDFNDFRMVSPVDYGSSSINSRHTVHLDPTETDLRTGGMAKTVPDGAIGSVRLGNWDVGAQAERIEYSFVVDTAYPILYVKYLPILEAPSHYDYENPRFKIDVLVNGYTIGRCGEFDINANDLFNGSSLTPEAISDGWHITPAATSQTSADIVWKDWTTVGINLSSSHLQGQIVTVRLTTHDCIFAAHCGYAYFTLGCSDASLKNYQEGAINPVLEAPDGFDYRWAYASSERYRQWDGSLPEQYILSRSQVFEAGYQDDSLYVVDCMFRGDTSCFFTLYASAQPAEPQPCLIASGYCGAQGDNLTWELGCDSVLTISGYGEMADWNQYAYPWNEYNSIIKSVLISDSVTHIGRNAFYQCQALTSVNLPENVISIGEGAFEGCTSLPVEDNLRYVGNYLVEAADKTLSTYTIREGTKWIGSRAFSGCMMTSISIPNSVAEIQGAAFYRCSSLRSIELPSGLTRIAHQTFLLCDSLQSVIIPDGVTEIDYGAFEDCRSLESIVIPDSVVYIWYGAFAGCRSLTSITIPSSVLEFSYNPRHKDAPAAFAGCTGLTAINVSPYNPNYCSIDGVVFTKDVQKLIQYPGGKRGAYTIPDGVRVIDEWSFSECYGLTSVTIPNTVITMKDFAFSYCYALSSVTLPNSIDTLGYGVFESCSGLTSITCEAVELPSMDGHVFDGVDKSIPLYVPAESIEYYRAANQWKNFTNILPIPSVQYTISVAVNDSNYGTAYGSGTFAEDSMVLIWATPNYGYHFVRWSDGNRTNPRRIEVTQDSTFIAYFAVDRIGYCGDSLALIWEYDATAKALTISGNGALNSNYTFGAEAPTAVENLIIAEGVTAIGQNAFANYATIKHISVPTTVARIHSQAFYDCVGLEEIYSYRETPCVAYSNTFDGIDKFSCTLHVLSASVSKYQIATGWRDFPNIQTIDAQTVTEVIEEVETVPADNNVTITWPVSEGADTYTIEVSKNGVVVCRLIFDANGQLLGIAFAPGRRGGAQAPAAVKTENGGLRFTITGLESGTDYQVTVIAKDENEEVVEEYVSDFTTSGAEEDTPTGLDTIDATNQATKILRNGQIFILRGDKVYTLQGQEVR